MRNEPALVIGTLLAILVAASEFFLGWGADQAWQTALGTGLAKGGAVLAGTFGIRQSVYGPRTVDSVMDAETVISSAERR